MDQGWMDYTRYHPQIKCEGTETMSKTKRKKIRKRMSRGKDIPWVVMRRAGSTKETYCKWADCHRLLLHHILDLCWIWWPVFFHLLNPTGQARQAVSLNSVQFILFPHTHYSPFFTTSKLEEITLFLISDLPNLINSPSEISIHSFLLNSTGNFATVSFFLT